MDIVDRAKIKEMQDRDDAIARELASHADTTPPLIIDGVRCCIDCLDPIPVDRLQARPDAVRCIDCKELLERRRV